MPAPKTSENDQAIVDAAFEKLLSSQRGILAKMEFGNSSSEFQFSEGPDNLPIISPDASADFDSSYTGYHYHQQSQHYYQESIRDGQFISEQLSDVDNGFGPEIFDDGTELRVQRKRQTERELMEVVAERRRKKQRRGSIKFTPTPEPNFTTDTLSPEPSFSDDMLPSPCDLDLDEDPLLLDDLEFPSIHSTTDASLSLADIARDDADDDDLTDEEKESNDGFASMEQEPIKEMETTIKPKEKVRSPPKRSQKGLWKPRATPSPEKEESPSSSSNMTVNIATTSKDDVPETPVATVTSFFTGEAQTPVRIVSRNPSSQSQSSATSSSDDDNDDGVLTPPTVQGLSVALQKSIDTMKSIQDWDKKMGLKRSHSKTMRQSAQTRERLLAFFNKEKAIVTPPAAAAAAAVASKEENEEDTQSSNNNSSSCVDLTETPAVVES